MSGTYMGQVTDGDPDHALIWSIAEGNAKALDELYARYGPSILNFLVARLSDRQLAEEVLQDVMLAVWNSSANFRGESKVLTWLLTIARNRAINTQRKRRPQIVEFDEELKITNDETGPLERMVKQGQYSIVREAIEALPAGQRETLTLVFYHQLSGVEVAEAVGVSVGTVKSRLHRAKETLRRILRGEESL
jgi:RNA polymerase sigma-70 factor (ECF subfamily)